jgi:hypothetical protein
VIVFFFLDGENDRRVISVQSLPSTRVCIYAYHDHSQIHSHGDGDIDTESIIDPNTHTHIHTQYRAPPAPCRLGVGGVQVHQKIKIQNNF